MEKTENTTESTRVTQRSIHHDADGNLRHLTLFVKRHGQRLRRTDDFGPRGFETSRELTSVRSRRSVLKPNPVRLERVHSKVVIVALHVWEPSREVKPTDGFDERVSSERTHDWANKLKVFREFIPDRGEAGSQACLALDDEFIRFNRKRVRRAVEHGVFVADVVNRGRIGRVEFG